MTRLSESRTTKTPALYNSEAEQLIIGSILINPGCFSRVRTQLTLEDFGLEKHQILFKTILSMADTGAPIELTALLAYLGRNGGLAKVGGKAYLVDLVDSIGTSAAVDYYIEEIKEVRAKRTLYLALLTGQDALNKGTPYREVSAQLKAEFGELEREMPTGDITIVKADEILNTQFEKVKEVIGKGILPEGGSMILAGESGVGKSMLRTEIGIHLAKAWDLYGLPVEASKKVLIIQFENPERTEKYRLKKMLQGFNADSFNDNFIVADPRLRFDLSRITDRQKLLNLVRQSNTEVVIYDPLASLHSENENDNSKMRSVLDTLTHINKTAKTSAILIHHFGKPDKDHPKGTDYRLRGATAIKDWTDTAITISKNAHPHKQILKMEFIKIRNGPPHAPILLERDKTYFTHSVIQEDNLVPPDKVRDILGGLGGTVESQGELIDAIIEERGCARNSARKYISNAIGKTISEFKIDQRTKGYRLRDYEKD